MRHAIIWQIAVVAAAISSFATTPAHADETSTIDWYSAEVHVGAVIGLHGWASRSSDPYPNLAGSSEQGVWGGIYLSAYGVPSDYVHIGGYLHYSAGGETGVATDTYGIRTDYSADDGAFGFGVSGKFGARLGSRFWLGGVLDVGLHIFTPGTWSGQAYSHTDTMYGVELSPRIHFDVLAADFDGFKLGAFVSFGPSAVPYSTGGDVKIWLVSLRGIVGLTLGG